MQKNTRLYVSLPPLSSNGRALLGPYTNVLFFKDGSYSCSEVSPRNKLRCLGGSIPFTVLLQNLATALRFWYNAVAGEAEKELTMTAQACPTWGKIVIGEDRLKNFCDVR